MRQRIRRLTSDPNVIGVQEQRMYCELLSRMVDDRLGEQAARGHVDVTPEENDCGISRIAVQAQRQQDVP